MNGLQEAMHLALSRRARTRTLRVALVVGTLVSLINQGGPIAAGHATAGTWARVAANYLLPLCVSSFGFVAAVRSEERPGRP